MSAVDSELPVEWQYYRDRAAEAQLGRADHFGQGREEQLWEMLAVIERGEPLTEARRRRLDRIPQNRAKKHLRLLQELDLMARATHSVKSNVVEIRDSAEFVERHLSPWERDVERRLAAGATFNDVGTAVGLAVATLKMRASRWRKRVRRHLTGRDVLGVT